MKPEQKKWLLLFLLLALTVLVTALLRVPVPLSVTIGGRDAGVYVTLGDVCVFFAVLLCGTPWGALIAALGMALADLLVGSYSYIIGSFLIKGGMALMECLAAGKRSRRAARPFKITRYHALLRLEGLLSRGVPRRGHYDRGLFRV